MAEDFCMAIFRGSLTTFRTSTTKYNISYENDYNGADVSSETKLMSNIHFWIGN